MRTSAGLASRIAVLVLSFALVAAGAAAAGEATVSGTFTFNGAEVKLPYVYVIALDKGFYEETDPTWKIIFVDQPVEQRKLDEHIWNAALLELGVTRTATFDDKPTLQVYSQSVVPAADHAGNLSGGTYPELEVEVFGPDRFVGRVYLKEPQKFFEDTCFYDFRFSAPLSDPDAPLGAALPAGGGEPGKAYLAWVEAVHSGDLPRLEALVPAEMGAEFEGEKAGETLEFLQLLTPKEVRILGGSSDGETAVLQVEGVMDGEKQTGEVTLRKKGDLWVAAGSSW